jgi:hypothetical protein
MEITTALIEDLMMGTKRIEVEGHCLNNGDPEYCLRVRIIGDDAQKVFIGGVKELFELLATHTYSTWSWDKGLSNHSDEP